MQRQSSWVEKLERQSPQLCYFLSFLSLLQLLLPRCREGDGEKKASSPPIYLLSQSVSPTTLLELKLQSTLKFTKLASCSCSRSANLIYSTTLYNLTVWAALRAQFEQHWCSSRGLAVTEKRFLLLFPFFFFFFFFFI